MELFLGEKASAVEGECLEQSPLGFLEGPGTSNSKAYFLGFQSLLIF